MVRRLPRARTKTPSTAIHSKQLDGKPHDPADPSSASAYSIPPITARQSAATGHVVLFPDTGAENTKVGLFSTSRTIAPFSM